MRLIGVALVAATLFAAAGTAYTVANADGVADSRLAYEARR